MTTKFVFIACLLISTAASATSVQTDRTTAQDPTILLAMNNTTWSYAAASNSQGLTNVREFHDMGASGVQQIDYVVNCANQTMAMSGFQILKGLGIESVGFVAPKTQKLSFYTPAIDHDKQIASNTCSKQVAMNSYTTGN